MLLKVDDVTWVNPREVVSVVDDFTVDLGYEFHYAKIIFKNGTSVNVHTVTVPRAKSDETATIKEIEDLINDKIKEIVNKIDY